MTGQSRSRLADSSWFGAAAALLGALAAFPLQAQPAEGEFFRGKTITVVVGTPPGGGYDAYARLMAAHIARHIPGRPTLVVQNMPGGSSLRSANYLHSHAAKDGTVVAMFASSAVFAPVFGNKAAEFKAGDFTWLGNFNQETGTCAVWHTSGLRSFQDVLTQQAIFGGSTPGGLGSEYARSMNALFGTRIRVIHGYAGATSVLLAMERGEVQGGCGFPLASLESVRREDYESGRLIPIVQFALRSPKLKNVPHIIEFARSEEDKQVFNLIYNRDILGRPVAAPPGLSPARTKIWRDAFKALIADEEFRNTADKQFLVLAPQTGEEVEAFMRDISSYSPQVIDKALNAIAIGQVENVELKSLDGVIAKIERGGIEVKDGAGKTTGVKVSDDETQIMVKGQKADKAALKTDMQCSLRHLGEGDFAKTIACN